MKASASAGRCSGRVLSLAMALSNVAVSGPCGVMHTCKLAPAYTHVCLFGDLSHTTRASGAPRHLRSLTQPAQVLAIRDTYTNRLLTIAQEPVLFLEKGVSDG